MIDELRAVLLRVGAWLLAIALGLVVLLVILRAVLPALATSATAFVATPGGLLLLVVLWRYLSRRKR